MTMYDNPNQEVVGIDILSGEGNSPEEPEPVEPTEPEPVEPEPE